MLTWKLWRALNRPPGRLPLYRRIYQTQQASVSFDLRQIPLFDLFRNAGLVVLPIFLILIGAPGLVLLSYVSLLIAPVLLPFANTVYGVALAVGVGSGITKERERRTYNVLCATPHGTLGIHWSYCIGWIRAHVGYRYGLLAVLAIGIVASVFGLPAQAIFGAGQVSPGVALARGLALGTIFVVDYAQSIILSSLLSLLIPTRVENETDARLWAATAFVTMQIAVYLPTLLLAVYALPNTLLLLGVDPLLGSLLIPLLMVGFFLTLRALIITALWHVVEQQLTTTAVELDAITGLAV